MGMTEEQYWKGPPRLVQTYIKLNELKNEKENNSAWWQGFYFYRGVDTVAHNLARRKHEPAESYPKQPLRIKPYTKAEKEEMAERERKKAFEFFSSQQKQWRQRNGG